MKSFRTLASLIVILAVVLCLPLFAEEEKKVSSSFPLLDSFAKKGPNVEVVADSLEYVKDQKKVIAKKNVVLTYQDTKITSDYAEVETETKKAYARGHVIIFQKEKPTARGEEVTYNFATHEGNFPDARAISYPWYGSGENIQQTKDGVTVIKNGSVTTCDRENPHYEIRAQKATIHTGDKIVAWNVRIYVLGKPVFWWPYLVIPLQDRNLPFQVNAGYNSKNGAYIETTKGFSITKNVFGKILADWRSKRGFGAGGVLDYDFGHYGQGSFIGYLTQDERAPTPGLDPPPGSSPNAEPPSPYSELEDRERGRISWRHRTDFDPYTNLILRYNRFADEYVLQDFFEKEHRKEIEPQSFVTFTKNSEQYGFLTTVQKSMNSFEALVERLPTVQFDWKNQPFFFPGLFYENQSSFSNLTKRLSRSDYTEDVVRLDTFHEWSLPLKWKEIKLTPYSNFRGTYYSREKESNEKQYRVAVGYGADLRTQFYKTFHTTFNKMGIEVNNLRHIFEPSVRYDAIGLSTVSDETLHHFDSIDRVDNRQVITLGLENRLQTKRVINGKMQRVDIVSLNTFLSYDIHPDTPPTRSNFKIWSQEVVLRPYQWMQYEVRYDYDMERDQFRVFNQDLLARTRRFKFQFGYRFLKDAQIVSQGQVETSHQFVFNTRWVINPLWEIGGYIRWDADQQELEEWQVSASRDLHDFIFDFGYNVRNSDINSNNKELFFSFRMKAFPQYNLHGGGSRASFAEPRIGETVAGANQLSGGSGDSLDSWSQGYAGRS